MNDIMNMGTDINYSREFYKAKEHNYNEFFKNYIIDEKEVAAIKKEIKKLSDMIFEQNEKYAITMNKRYNVQLVAPEKYPLFMYENRNGVKFYFDSETGAPVAIDADDMANYNIITLDAKSGNVNIVGGYALELGAVTIRNYKYTIPANNSRISMNFMSEILIPIIEKEAHAIRSFSDGTITDAGVMNGAYWDYTSWLKPLEKYEGKDFLSKFYGINAESCDINLLEVMKAYRGNASVETLVRQGTPNSMRKLLNIQNKEFKSSIAQYLSLTKPEFKQVTESGILNDYVDFYIAMQDLDSKNNANWEKLNTNKTMPEWIDYLLKAKGWKEDFDFYGIRTNGNVLIELLHCYIGERYYYNGGNFKRFPEYYSFGDFCSYVIEGCVNQGYTSLRDFVKELEDYLIMAMQLGVKPTLNSSYLKQTHDIMARNYKIKIDAMQEEIFASRYKDYKAWTSKDKKYTLIAPKNTDDVKLEGSQMNNCVASYIKRILDDTCKIFFFRAANKPNDSYITVEYRDDAMVQVKRSHNRAPSEKDVEYLKECCEAKGWKYKG